MVGLEVGCVSNLRGVEEKDWYEPEIQTPLLDELILHLKKNRDQRKLTSGVVQPHLWQRE